MNHWTAPDSHKHPFSTKSSSPLSPTPRRKPAAHTSLSILTASVCVKNAVPLTFLMYWPLLPVKPLFLKGMLLWAKPWNIHWHRLQDRFHKETAKSHSELCSSPGTASAPSTSHCPDDQVWKWRRDKAQVQGKETFPKMGKPTGPKRSISPANGVILCLEVMPHQSFLSLLDPSPRILPFLPLIKYTYLSSFFSQMKRGDIWCCWDK